MIPQSHDELTLEYIAFCNQHGYEPMSADELLFELYDIDEPTEQDRIHMEYLSDFIERWEDSFWNNFLE